MMKFKFGAGYLGFEHVSHQAAMEALPPWLHRTLYGMWSEGSIIVIGGDYAAFSLGYLVRLKY